MFMEKLLNNYLYEHPYILGALLILTAIFCLWMIAMFMVNVFKSTEAKLGGSGDTSIFFEEVTANVRDWQEKTFGNKPARGSLLHLKEEIDELIEELDSKNSKKVESEFADCFILLISALYEAGYSIEDAKLFIMDKLEVVKKRRWENPDENGVYRHVKGSCSEDQL